LAIEAGAMIAQTRPFGLSLMIALVSRWRSEKDYLP
jgi:hypothetical protein